MGPLQTPKTAHFSPRLPLNPGNVEQGGASAAGSHTFTPHWTLVRFYGHRITLMCVKAAMALAMCEESDSLLNHSHYFHCR